MRWLKSLCVAFFALVSVASASAAAIQASYTSLGGNAWSAAFTVTNNGDAAPISEFTVFFSEALFSNLSLGGSPSTWDSIIIQPDTGIPAAGYLDALELDSNDALGLGASQGGFVVSFDFLGQGAPGVLPFDIVDPNNNFALVSSGRTTSVFTNPGTVPEPNGLALALLAIFAAGAKRGALRFQWIRCNVLAKQTRGA
ncbi:MAG: hypothetical protein H7232_03680 [Aeromicrobium sp.]|nr:hypothetical protein [Burkholderiales bacterium]